MPMIWIPEAELRALQAIFLQKEQVDWSAYDRAKEYVIDAQTTEPKAADPEPEPVLS